MVDTLHTKGRRVNQWVAFTLLSPGSPVDGFVKSLFVNEYLRAVSSPLRWSFLLIVILTRESIRCYVGPLVICSMYKRFPRHCFSAPTHPSLTVAPLDLFSFRKAFPLLIVMHLLLCSALVSAAIFLLSLLFSSLFISFYHLDISFCFLHWFIPFIHRAF